jgi:hypothetical protein
MAVEQVVDVDADSRTVTTGECPGITHVQARDVIARELYVVRSEVKVLPVYVSKIDASNPLRRKYSPKFAITFG